MRIINLILLTCLLFEPNAKALTVSLAKVSGLAFHSTGNGTAPPPPTCFDIGHACSTNSQCCTNICSASLCVNVLPPPPKPKVLTLGDSITNGANDNTCNSNSTNGCFGYRDHLQDLLGIGVYDFVGDRQDPLSDPVYDVDNAGVNGQTTAQIKARLITILGNVLAGPVPPGSMALIHAGTNDIRNGSASQATAVQNVIDMVNLIDIHQPTIAIYVALVVPNYATAAMTAYNVALNTALQTRQGTKANLHIVDMEHAFKNSSNCGSSYSNCMTDGASNALHPDDTLPFAGYQVMARQWNFCITNPTHQYCDGH